VLRNGVAGASSFWRERPWLKVFLSEGSGTSNLYVEYTGTALNRRSN